MDNIHEGHRGRVKSQFLENGISALLPHQILEMLLFYALPRGDTNIIAHRLLEKFETISGVFNAPIEELITVKGVTENVATLIKFIPQLLSAYSIDSIKNKPLTELSTIAEYFVSCYLGVRTEQLRVCCLDDNLNIISCSVIQDGGVSTVPVNVRKIVETTFKANSSLIILAHNHPNGIAIPSDTDVKVTRQIKQTLSSVGINLLDHVIVSSNNAVSMKYAGYFNTFDL